MIQSFTTLRAQVGKIERLIGDAGWLRSIVGGQPAAFRLSGCDSNLKRVLGTLRGSDKLKEVRIFYLFTPCTGIAQARDLKLYRAALMGPWLSSYAPELLNELNGWRGEHSLADIEFYVDVLEANEGLSAQVIHMLSNSEFGRKPGNLLRLRESIKIELREGFIAELDLRNRWDNPENIDNYETTRLSEALMEPKELQLRLSARLAMLKNLRVEQLRNNTQSALKEKATEREKWKQRVARRAELIKASCWDPTGLRFAHFMRHSCLTCEKQTSPKRGTHYCLDGCTKWYANDCWNCGEPVDCRDPATPHCDSWKIKRGKSIEEQCGWCRCASCSACDMEGCPSNPHVKL